MNAKWVECPLLSAIPEEDLRQAMALGLYSGWQLSLDSAASLAGLDVMEFETLLRKRCIPRHYIRTELTSPTHLPVTPQKKAFCNTN